MATTLELTIQRTAIGNVATLSNLELHRVSPVTRVCLYRGPAVENSKLRIAPGEYEARWTRSPRFSKEAGRDVFTWEILGVMDGTRERAGIRIHPANFAKDLLGCVAPGMAVADIDHDGEYDVTSSRKAMEIFVDACKAYDTMKVVVRDPAIV